MDTRRKPTPPQPTALTIRDFCIAFDTSPSTVWRAISSGKLKTVALNGPGSKRLILLDSVGKRRDDPARENH
jgi:hypothetical protein